ncbi:tyrosine-type recombinase/integrase [Micromonospora sp. DT47]|uniref:tyrosine-type recombinase/integrase n=1 Tax=Micromonospora sp. DT47 TaxID=3393431 RepID=UPI003CE827DC
MLGLRRSEALGLRWDDVDLEAGVLRVRHDKQQRSARAVPLRALVVRALRDHQRGQEGERPGRITIRAPGSPLHASQPQSRHRRRRRPPPTMKMAR